MDGNAITSDDKVKSLGINVDRNLAYLTITLIIYLLNSPNHQEYYVGSVILYLLLSIGSYMTYLFIHIYSMVPKFGVMPIGIPDLILFKRELYE